MAEEQDLKMEEESSEGAASGGSKKWLFIILGVVILLIAGGAAAYYFLLREDESEKEEEDDEEIVEEKNDTSAVDPGAAPLGPITYFQMKEPFIIDFNQNGRQRFLQLKVTLMYRDPEVMGVLDNHMPLVRNNIISIIGSQDFNSLRTPEGKESLSKSIHDELNLMMNRELGRVAIDKVLFTEFVMQ